ncbi:MAG: hypothetical protein V5A46_09665 [Haloferacaceae archaeon]
MPCTAPGSGPPVSEGLDRSQLAAISDEAYRCEVLYDVGDGSKSDREWWLLKITSWMVERGSVSDVTFTRSPDDSSLRVEFCFERPHDCRRFRDRESHKLVVDGERIVGSQVVSRCDVPE